MSVIIKEIQAEDRRFDLLDGAGTDAVHKDPQYGYGVTRITTECNKFLGTGIAYTLGGGTELVREAIKLLSHELVGKDIEVLMSEFGSFQRSLAEHHQIRWLGPHKGVIHLALASITNACFDLWAKSRGVPLWKLLLELEPNQLVSLIDFSYLEEVLTPAEACSIIKERLPSRKDREPLLNEGYPGYDTSVGWFAYSDERIIENARKAMDQGFTAMKLKVGSPDSLRDIRRANLVRETVGDEARIMVDANQAWSLPRALEVCQKLKDMNPYWVEEPTQPDDILAHKEIADSIKPIPVAVGEAVSNRVIWKNFLQSEAVGVVQADCTRLAGISEYLAVSILATKYPVKVIPHVGDMGQIHQHIVFFNHIALNHSKYFLEYIPHLRDHFVYPATVKDGLYQLPQEPGCSTDLKIA